MCLGLVYVFCTITPTGSPASGNVLGEVCKEATPTFQGMEQSVSLLFSTDNSYADKGFVLSYKENDGTVRLNVCLFILMS